MRKNKKTGRVDRNVYIRAHFTVDKTFDLVESGNNRSKATLYANILKIDVFENEGDASAILSTIETDFAKLQKADKALTQQKTTEKQNVVQEKYEVVSNMRNYLSSQEDIGEDLKKDLLDKTITHYEGE
ncbi:MAG: hypothetical protein HC896_06815 [Bacteroidales bacterium]|nr:hypothetical protein [Bacteroidales bacterium]